MDEDARALDVPENSIPRPHFVRAPIRPICGNHLRSNSPSAMLRLGFKVVNGSRVLGVAVETRAGADFLAGGRSG